MKIAQKLTKAADAADLDLRTAIYHIGRAKTGAINARDEHAEIILEYALHMLYRLSIQAVKTQRVVFVPRDLI